MNQFVKTYATAKAAYDTILEKIKNELKAIPEYQQAQALMTCELLRTDEAEFDRLNLFVCEQEASLDARYRKWDLFDCLDLAEKLLIDEYSHFILKKEAVPSIVRQLFSSPDLQTVKGSPTKRQKLIKIILQTPGF